MASYDWKKLVGTLAPAVATAFGTPAMGLAVSALSNAIFGRSDASADEVATAIAGGQLTGEQIAAIRAADNQFKIQMRQLDIDLVKLEQASELAYLEDVQDARARQVATKDNTPQVILAVLFLLWAGTFALFYFAPLPADEFLRALIVRAYATVETGLTGAIAYFIGSSRGSKQSGDAVRRIAEKKDEGK